MACSRAGEIMPCTRAKASMVAMMRAFMWPFSGHKRTWGCDGHHSCGGHAAQAASSEQAGQGGLQVGVAKGESGLLQALRQHALAAQEQFFTHFAEHQLYGKFR